MSLRDELNNIRAKHGSLTPAFVVDEWRPADHPYHGKLEWDDAVGGEAYRRVQAAEIIRSIRVTYLPATGPQTSVRAFHAVRDPQRGHVYDPVEEVVSDPVARALLLRDMERDWRALRARWEHFAEFAEMVLGDLSKTA